MTERHFNLIVAELRRSKKVYGGPITAFAQWLCNYFIPQAQFSHPGFSATQAERLVREVL